MKPISPVLPGYEVPEVVFAKNQPEYIQLPAVKFESPEGQILTRWELSDEDRQMIAEGADVYLWVNTFDRPLQPVVLEVTTAKAIMGRACDEDAILNAEVIG
jgi:hypothetical protein